MKHCVIIGGGIIGLCTAYYLRKEGHQVTVIDKSDFSSGASYVNAGYITPSHIISLAAPGMITKGLKWMFDSSSPFYIKPRLELDFLQWAWAFKRSATHAKVARSIPVIKDINLLSRELYEAMKASNDFNFHYEHKGLLMAYQNEKVGEEEWEVGQKAIEIGMKVEHLSKSQVDTLQPKAKLNCKGAVYFHSDAHMTPGDFMKDMLSYLTANGVEVLANEAVEQMEHTNGKVTKIISAKRTLIADEFIVATGSWSPILSKQLGIKLLVQAGKGYRINVPRETHITLPTILCEAKVAVTPMDGFTRFAGTMEIAGINHNIRPERVAAIAHAAQSYYNDLHISSEEQSDAQCGLRPVSPDGLPYIGRPSSFSNLTIATGHAMMGWSMGPATGKLVAELISEQKSSLDLTPFNVGRSF